MNKKKKRETASILIMLVLGALLIMNQMGTSRTGVNTDFNNWYEDNSIAVLIAGIFTLVVLILWGFYEGKAEKGVRLYKEQTSADIARARAGKKYN